MFCPGCGHGIVVRVLCEVLEEKGLSNRNIIAAGVGCSCHLWALDGDVLQCSHGRAAAAARGIKSCRPELFVATYQGDGDGYVIGIEHTINAAYQKANILMITINNSNFGMTGGQMAWTTLPGQVTATSPYGRPLDGPLPIHVPEMVASDFDPAFVARASVHNAAEIRKLKKYMERAVEAQMNNEGFCMIEVCCPCPTNWGMSVEKSYKHVENKVTEFYTLGIIRDREKGV
ncbi:MAG: thiamine pyrophosphate-dependent enzyme [Clostridiales bacterium]|nr:thiamine pyrophosphate-dependent enzyme [Clostridiales bacterium]